jgi:hypothetical protein
MDSLIHRGMNQIATELKKVDADIKNLDNHDKSKTIVEKSFKALEKTIAETSAVNNSEIIENHLKKISNNISTINEKLNSTDKLDNKTFANLKKDILDEVGMLMIGVNNINHYLLDLINQNDKTFYNIEEKLDKLEFRGKVQTGLVALIILVLIIQILLFLGVI